MLWTGAQRVTSTGDGSPSPAEIAVDGASSVVEQTTGRATATAGTVHSENNRSRSLNRSLSKGRGTTARKLGRGSAKHQPPMPVNSDPSMDRQVLLERLAREAYRHGQFTLASGRSSEHYVNCKPVALSGSGLALLCPAMLALVEKDAVAVGGLTLGADPLVSGVAMAAAQKGRDLNALIVRKQAKGHGTGAWLEGPLPQAGALVTVLEDVVTTGGSSIQAVNQLRQAGYSVQRVITIVDREEGGQHAMDEAGLQLVSLFRLSEVAAKARELQQ